MQTFSCRSKADRAVHIAALCHFQYHTTAFSFVLLTESTIIRAGFLFDFGIYRSLRRQVFSSPGKILCCRSFPDQCLKLSVDITFFHQINAIFTNTFFCRKYFHTYRAYTFCFTQRNHSSNIPRFVSISITFV